MAVDLLTNFPGWSTNFELMFRQERSRTASGRTLVKDLGDPLWRGVYQTRVLRPNQLSAWRAKLDAMGNGIGIFEGRDLSRCFPIADPRGATLSGKGVSPTLILDFIGDFSFVGPPGVSTPVVAEADGTNQILSVSGLPRNYLMSQGDMISYRLSNGSRFMHRVTQGALANSLGVVRLKVAPALAFGITMGNPVDIARPWVPMSIVPGSISSSSDLDGRGTITFEGLEAR